MAATASHLAHRRWLSPERVSAGVSIALLTLLEALPIEAALLALTGANGVSLSQAFGPFWLIVATMLLFALARWRMRDTRPVLLAASALGIGLVTAALFVALSPTAYGSAPGGIFSAAWLTQLISDAANDAPRFNGLFVIAPIIAYLGWRGLILGGPLPKIDVTLRRFMLSLAVVMFACVCGLAVPAMFQPALQGVLLPLLALDAFSGLAAAALSRRSIESERLQVNTSSETTRWLLIACGAAALVIALAYLIGLALNFQLLSSGFAALRPLGAYINAAVTWLVNGIAYILWIVFVKTLGAWLFQNSAFYVTPPRSVGITPKTAPHPKIAPSVPEGFVIAAGVIVGLIVIVVIVLAVTTSIRALLRALNAGFEPEADEEREALDARGLLARQMRDLLSALRRSPGERDPLTAGSARWLYREALRAGAAAGVGRQPGETADEYSQRLDVTLREHAPVGGDTARLATLTRAYDDARYGADNERQTKAAPEVAAASRWLTGALRRIRG